MLANRREKIIALVAGTGLALLLLYWYVWMPYSDARDKVSADLKTAIGKEKTAQKLLDGRKKVDADWHNMLTTGLHTDPAAAESQALHAMRNFAERSRIDLQALKPDRVGRSGDFQQIRLQATGLGTTAAFADLLYQIETANIPLKVNEFRLTSRKEGSDDLSFALSVSTIAFSPAPEKPAPGRASTKGEAR